MKVKSIYFFLFSLLLVTLSCSDDSDDPAPIPLIANAGEPQTVSPGTLVTLDGSASTGPEGFRYEWEFSGSSNGASVELSSTSEAIVTFTPPRTGSYNFNLAIRQGDRIGTSSVTVTVEGSIDLNSVSFNNGFLALDDINDSGPDYIVNTDFTIASGNIMSIANSSVEIAFAENAGLIVNGSMDVQQFTSLTPSNNVSWKGVLVDGGVINSNNTLDVLYAGSMPFSGQEEAAAITVQNQGVLIGNFYMQNSPDVDTEIGILYDETASRSVQSGFIDIRGYKIPAKLPISHLSLTSIISPDNYDYIELITQGADVSDASQSEFLFQDKDYLLDRSFTASANINAFNATIYMNENEGIVSVGNMQLNNSTIRGLNEATWKGIAAIGDLTLTGAFVSGGGEATHNTGAFTTEETAAIYAGRRLDMTGTTVSNSGGHAIYVGNSDGAITISSSAFESINAYDLSVPSNRIDFLSIADANNWSSNAVLLRGSSIPGGRIRPLTNGAAYHNESNLIVTSDLELLAGVNMKFADNTGLIISFARLTANGTAEFPITFTGINDGAGSWNGIELTGTYNMTFCEISDAGQNAFLIEKANIVFAGGSDSDASPNNNYQFENNTISNSEGYGAVVRLGRFDPFQGNDTNTFTDNTSGDIKLP